MSRIQNFLNELNAESETTRKMLERVPNDKYDWKPHEKSMDIRSLATHIADLPTWITLAFTTKELDFASAPYEAKQIANTTELMQYFEESLVSGRSLLVQESEAVLDEEWILRNGREILTRTTKAGLVRIALSQVIHHRAQLGVYLRLLNIAIPGSYGPSADEQFVPIEVLEEA